VRKTNCRWTTIRASDSSRGITIANESLLQAYVETDTSKLAYKIQRFRGTEEVHNIYKACPLTHHQRTFCLTRKRKKKNSQHSSLEERRSKEPPTIGGVGQETNWKRETQPTAPVAKQQKINQSINQSNKTSQKSGIEFIRVAQGNTKINRK
jgi:hypothetical protein